MIRARSDAMTNARDRIRLTEGEQRELLEEARTLHVASILPNGRPHLVPMWFVVDDDGLLAFTTYGTSQKVKNLERDPRITVMAETGTAYDELRGVAIDGTAEIVRDPRVTMRTLQLVGAKMGGQGRPAPPPEDEEPPPVAYKRVTVRVHPERIRSWDHRKLG
jgi:PPOX class probable F420-dependent enzyme